MKYQNLMLQLHNCIYSIEVSNYWLPFQANILHLADGDKRAIFYTTNLTPLFTTRIVTLHGGFPILVPFQVYN